MSESTPASGASWVPTDEFVTESNIGKEGTSEDRSAHRLGASASHPSRPRVRRGIVSHCHIGETRICGCRRPTDAERHLMERGAQGFRVIASAEAPPWRNYRGLHFAPASDTSQETASAEAVTDAK